MPSRILWIVALVGCLALAVLGFAAKPTKKQSGNHPALTIEFRDSQDDGTADQVQSDGLGLEHPNCQVAASCYIDGKQKVEAKAGGEVQPNPPGIRLVTNRSGNPGAGRQLFLDLSKCKEFGNGNPCPLPAPFDTNRVFVDARIRVRPLGGDFDIFYTMPLNSAHDMGLTIVPLIPDHQLWVAFDPLTTEDPGLGFCSTPGQAVSVTAISRDAQDKNNAWEVKATGTRAVVCGREVSPLGVQRDFGDLPMTFKFTAKVLPKKKKGKK